MKKKEINIFVLEELLQLRLIFAIETVHLVVDFLNSCLLCISL